MVAAAAFFLIGAASVLYGVAHIYGPAAWIVFGLFSLFLALWPFVRRS